jgi:hypothetical protein
MARLFEPGLVYPEDREGGRYVELDGDVIEVGDPSLGSSPAVRVRVRTKKGDFDGYARLPSSRSICPKVGHHATIRLYDSGGGWYPDDRIVSWGTLAAPIEYGTIHSV